MRSSIAADSSCAAHRRASVPAALLRCSEGWRSSARQQDCATPSHSLSIKDQAMSIHQTSRSRLAPAIAILILALAGLAGVATPDSDASENVAVSHANCTYETLDYPGAFATIFWGLNDFGELSCQYTMSGFPGNAMAYRHGRFKTLDPDGLSATTSAPPAVPTISARSSAVIRTRRHCSMAS
jgi:hypothetical protein